MKKIGLIFVFFSVAMFAMEKQQIDPETIAHATTLLIYGDEHSLLQNKLQTEIERVTKLNRRSSLEEMGKQAADILSRPVDPNKEDIMFVKRWAINTVLADSVRPRSSLLNPKKLAIGAGGLVLIGMWLGHKYLCSCDN